MSYFNVMRRNMVQGQLLPEGVEDSRILSAFSEIPREKFVSHHLGCMAYMDAEFPLPNGRALLRPATLACLFGACLFEASHNVLYVGCGTGYGPALLGYMGLRVIALDSIVEFTQGAERLLQELSLSSVEVMLGPLAEGWKQEGPYDRIIIEGAIERLPSCFEVQLKEGGEIVTIDALHPTFQQAVKYRKERTLLKMPLFYAGGTHLPGFEREELFVFSGKETDFVYGKS